jgi:hypothetical protein
MFGSKSEQGLLHLTADLLSGDGRASEPTSKPGGAVFGNLQRFPPIEELVTALDRIASRTTAV